MKIYRNEKTEDIQRMILLVELFANDKRLSFQIVINSCRLLKETKKMRNFKILFPFSISNLSDEIRVPKFINKKSMSHLSIYLC